MMTNGIAKLTQHALSLQQMNHVHHIMNFKSYGKITSLLPRQTLYYQYYSSTQWFTIICCLYNADNDLGHWKYKICIH